MFVVKPLVINLLVNIKTPGLKDMMGGGGGKSPVFDAIFDFF